MHIPDDPALIKVLFTPRRSGIKPVTTSIGSLGILVCWDQWFPEAARLMALAGAQLLIYPRQSDGTLRMPRMTEAAGEPELPYSGAMPSLMALPVLCVDH